MSNSKMWDMQQALKAAKEEMAVSVQTYKTLRAYEDFALVMKSSFEKAGLLKTLKARKTLMREAMVSVDVETLTLAAKAYELFTGYGRMAANRAATCYDCSLKATTFKEWAECWDEFIACFIDVRCILDVAARRVKSAMRLSAANVATWRELTSSSAKKLLPPVAVPKKQKKELIRARIFAHFHKEFISINCNNWLYFYAETMREQQLKESRGFRVTYKIWAMALALRSMFPRGA